jgi:hypothetical protein
MLNTEKKNNPTLYLHNDALLDSLREHIKLGEHVNFRGTYVIAKDPLVTDKERVQMTAEEIWKVTGYRFTYVP